MTNSKEKKILVIIGGGFSGTLLAIQLLRQARADLRKDLKEALDVVLIERSSQLGRGVAYGTSETQHLLNVPAGKMSLFPENPNHFLAWARKQNPDTQDTDFLPRSWYGDYIADCLKECLANLQDNICFRHYRGEAVEIQHLAPARFQILLQDGEILTANQVVLALGNAPSVLPQAFRSVQAPYRFLIPNPWQAGVLDRIQPDDSVFIVGTGLTMIDQVVALVNQEHKGRICAISRSGLLPQVHDLSRKPIEFKEFWDEPLSCLQLLQQIRRHVSRESGNWRSVLDGLRPHTQTIWSQLPQAEKRRFLRHLRPFWESHRHRMAPEIHQCIQQRLQSGQLRLLTGRIHSYEEGAEQAIIRYQPRWQAMLTEEKAHWVLNCAGAGGNFRQRQEPLIQSLLQSGLISSDELGLGLNALPDGQLLDATGHPVPGLYTLGPPLKGVLWETTAVPEIRVQAGKLASLLLHPAEMPVAASAI